MSDAERDAAGRLEDSAAADGPPVAIDPRYAAAISTIERRPENAPGADKSWVATLDDAFRRHYQQVRRS